MECAKDRFAEVLRDSKTQFVDPRACIPLTKVRRLSKSGVSRLAASLDGTRTFGTSGSASFGVASSSSLPVVVPLSGLLATETKAHFVSEGFSAEDAEEKEREHDQWYGIVDGAHRQAALMLLLEKQPEKWAGFRWTVTVAKPCSIPLMRAFARNSNEKQEDAFYVQATQYDLMRGILDEYEDMKREQPGRTVSAQEVADRYWGGVGHTPSTTVQICRATLRLDSDVIEEIGRIVNCEMSEEVKKISTHGASATSGSSPAEVDHRLLRNIFSTATIKGATHFLRGSSDAQICALRRARAISLGDGYKRISSVVLSTCYRKAVRALEEARKFESLLESSEWPNEMKIVQRNLLHTSRLDAQVAEMNGNGTAVLPVLLQKLRESMPAAAHQKIARYEESYGPVHIQTPLDAAQERVEATNGPAGDATHGCEGGVSTLCSNPSEPDECPSICAGGPDTALPDRTNGKSASQPDDPSNDGGGEVIEEPRDCAGGGLEEEANCVDSHVQSPHGEEGSPGNLALSRLGVEAFNMKWQSYYAQERDEGDKLFNLVLCDPPYNLPCGRTRVGKDYDDYIDDKEMADFAQFCRKVTVPFGAVLIFTSHILFPKWVSALKEVNMVVSEHPFVISKESRNIQKNRNVTFPQAVTEIVVMARAKGIRGSTQSPAPAYRGTRTAAYTKVSCSHKRVFAAMDFAPVPRRKLTFPDSRVQVRSEEKSVEVLEELMTTFSRPGDHVLDAYAGTLTTGIACVNSGRSCVLVEQDSKCYDVAMDRLRAVALAKISSGRSLRSRTVSSESHDANGVDAEGLEEAPSAPPSPELDFSQDSEQ